MRWLWLLFAIGCEAPTIPLPLTPPPPSPPPKIPIDAGMRPRPRDATVDELLPVRFEPRVIDFGSVVVGETRHGRLNAFNLNEHAELRVRIKSQLPSFFTASPASIVLAPDSSDYFEVSFTPSEALDYSADLELDACADDDCFAEVLLIGTGLEDMPRPDAGPMTNCGSTGPCPTQLLFGPVPVGTEALWNFYCSCPESSNFGAAEMDPPIEGASIRRVDAERLFLSFAPVVAGEFSTNVVFRNDQDELIVPLVLLAE